MKKFVVTAITLAAVSGAAFAYEGEIKEIAAHINEQINVYIDGEQAGEEFAPIIYEGRAYMPIRAVSEKLGIKIYWNEEQKSIELGAKKDAYQLTAADYEDRFYSEFTSDKELLTLGGNSSDYGIIFRRDYGDFGDYEGGYVNYAAVVKPGGNHTKFGGTIRMENNTNAEKVLFKFYENYVEDRLIKEIEVKRGEDVQFEIDISSVDKLYIYQRSEDRLEKFSDPVKMIIAEPYFK
ncbi:hypothetical protein EAL2_c17270 [Peptoclostridium acidaminophilum DSM 3953]|uniref:Copper amine oxidase-like N-terminal domain-containing protein n=1 Tax=Peptoclostridium acidaminophilum DSM 3953 TaxID=1286171 RepID=W8TLF0_PEPAC|nr:stalk domain-containing protein [Peptoclostridium acidaminophilum]AHM57022.1 hypothetical protein EAL2_c17270 [Peptoclostridium acidaminophilum DSM 3953]